MQMNIRTSKRYTNYLRERVLRKRITDGMKLNSALISPKNILIVSCNKEKLDDLFLLFLLSLLDDQCMTAFEIRRKARQT